MLCDNDGAILFIFSKHVGEMESNEIEVSVILEALRIFVAHFHSNLIVQSDLMNEVAQVSSSVAPPWRFYFNFNEIKYWVSHIQFEFDKFSCKFCG